MLDNFPIRNSYKKYIHFRNYKKYDANKFREDLTSISWKEVYECSDANLAYEKFHHSFIKICNRHAPIVSKTVNNKTIRKPWITKAIKKSIHTKHKLFNSVLKSNFSENIVSKYKKFRNILVSVMRKAKKMYYGDILTTHTKNDKKIWGIINELLGRKCSKSTLPESLIVNNCEVTDVNHIAEALNEHFVNIGPSLAKQINPTQRDFRDYLRNPLSCSFFLGPTSETEIYDSLLSLNPKKATGYDETPSKLLADAASAISKPLEFIFNLSFTTATFPDSLKIAKVIPVHKKGAMNDPNNYRPISILPILSKLLEKIFCTRLVKFINKNNIIYDHQYGFRAKYSTKLSLVNLVNYLIKQIDSGRVTLGIFLDFSKAFDTINHTILLQKLSYYGVRGLALQWIQSYLHHRYQYAGVNQTSSTHMPVTCGVPQGSVLGPILFLLFINDIHYATPYFDFRLFADDSNLFHTFPENSNNIDLTNSNNHLREVVQWCNANMLTINPNKTSFILFMSRKKQVAVSGTLNINNSVIKEVGEASFVGLIIDKHLTWYNHINKVNCTVRKKIGILFKLRQLLPRHILIQIYKSFIEPHITYGIEVWGSTYSTNLQSILKSQKMAARSITFSKPSASSAPLFQELQILDVFKLHKLYTCTFVHDLIHNRLPHPLTTYCALVEHKHGTRQKTSGNLTIPLLKSTLGQFSLSYIGSTLWNNLPNNIKSIKSRSTFRRFVKHLLLDEY